MGIYGGWWKVALALSLLASVSAHRGPLRHLGLCSSSSYWNESLQECVDCQVCQEVTIRPCELHRDAQCGTVKDLDIDWSFVKARPKAKSHRQDEQSPHHFIQLPPSWQETIREHDPDHQILRQMEANGLVFHEDELGGKILNFGDDYILPKDLKKQEEPRKKKDRKNPHKKHGHHHRTTTPRPLDYDDEEYLDDPVEPSTPTPPLKHKAKSVHAPANSANSPNSVGRDAKPRAQPNKAEEAAVTKGPVRLLYKVPYQDVFYDYTENQDDGDFQRRKVPPPVEPFSSVEALVWDWQAIVLVSAIGTCIIFFIVVVTYTCYYAQQWRKMKKSFDSDMEELSLRLNLINGMGLEHLQDPHAPPSGPGTLHLAHLIAQKQQEAVVNAVVPGTIRPNMNLYSTTSSLKKSHT